MKRGREHDDDDAQPSNSNSAPIPQNSKASRLRACLLCSLLMSPHEFRKLGCPNCEEILQMKNSPDRVSACTTTQFDGIIAVVDPDNSWVAKYQRISKQVRGMYAIRVKGRVPEDVEHELETRGIRYRPRDLTTDAE